MFTHFLPWLVAGLAAHFAFDFLLQRGLSIRLALPWGIAFPLFSFASLASWQYAVAMPLGMIAGVFLIDLLQIRS